MDATARLDWMNRDARDPLYRAANRIAIYRFGCSIDSLRDRVLAHALFAEAAERRSWWEQWRQQPQRRSA